MSKRGHFEEQDYIEWLKSLGCILYLPLSEDCDLQDHISGLSLQLTGQGSMVWDGSQQMYKITQPNSGFQYVAKLNNGLDKDSFPNDNFTTLHSVKRITKSSKYINTLSPQSTNGDTCAATTAVYNGTGRTNVWPTNLANVAYVSNNDQRNRSHYQNGELYTTFAEYLPSLPSNWVMNGTGFTIGCCRGATSIYYGTQFYMKEVYLFNTVLDLQIIRKIQGYE